MHNAEVVVPQVSEISALWEPLQQNLTTRNVTSSAPERSALETQLGFLTRHTLRRAQWSFNATRSNAVVRPRTPGSGAILDVGGQSPAPSLRSADSSRNYPIPILGAIRFTRIQSRGG